LAKNDSDETRNERAIAKLDEIWPFLEVMKVTPYDGQFRNCAINIMATLDEIRDILNV
jgi:hypothetical protein